MYYIEVIETATGSLIKAFTAGTERAAGRIERGLMMQMNHDDYHVRVVNEEQPHE